MAALPHYADDLLALNPLGPSSLSQFYLSGHSWAHSHRAGMEVAMRRLMTTRFPRIARPDPNSIKAHVTRQGGIATSALNYDVIRQTPLYSHDDVLKTALPLGTEERGQNGAASAEGLTFTSRKQLFSTRGELMLKNLTISELETWCLATGGRRLVQCPLNLLACHV